MQTAVYSLESACLYYDDKDIHKPSFLTFHALLIKKTKVIK